MSHEEVQIPEDGAGPLFHRRYRTRIRDTDLTPQALITDLSANLRRVAPREFASFQKTKGDEAVLARGDEYTVRMPGPWDGPVRVVAREPDMFRLATLESHLEAGQIEFRARRCRIGDVADEGRVEDGRPVRIWGWAYQTLEGHVEQGQMNWEVWKWTDTGAVQFRIHSYSRNARARNWFVNTSFKLFGQWQRRLYLDSACKRMAEMTRDDVGAR